MPKNLLKGAPHSGQLSLSGRSTYFFNGTGKELRSQEKKATKGQKSQQSFWQFQGGSGTKLGNWVLP